MCNSIFVLGGFKDYANTFFIINVVIMAPEKLKKITSFLTISESNSLKNSIMCSVKQNDG